MGKIDEIYSMLQDKVSKEEIRLDWERLGEFERKSKISLEEEKVFYPMVDYVEICELESFKKGFRYAVQLMKECGL